MSSSEENPILTTVSEEEEKLPITVLPPKQQRFVQLYMTGQYSIPKLADLLQVHPNTLHNWLKRKDVRAIVEDMQQSTHDIVGMQLKALTMTAVHKLGELTKSPIDGVALQAVKDILDRAGHKPKQEIKVDKTVRTFEEKLSEVMAKTIDVEYEVEE
jgi:transposase-like protein